MTRPGVTGVGHCYGFDTGRSLPFLILVPTTLASPARSSSSPTFSVLFSSLWQASPLCFCIPVASRLSLVHPNLSSACCVLRSPSSLLFWPSLRDMVCTERGYPNVHTAELTVCRVGSLCSPCGLEYHHRRTQHYCRRVLKYN